MNKKAFYLAAFLPFAGLVFSGLGPVPTAYAETPRENCVNSGGDWRMVDGGDSEFCVCPGGMVLDSEICIGNDSNNSGNSSSNDPAKDPDEEDAKRITDYVQKGVNLFTALAGVGIIIGFVIGGIQYSTSGGNPTAAAAARKKIGSALAGLLALVFLYTFLQWLVPGGIFSN